MEPKLILRETFLLAAARDLVELMHEWNRIDEHDLVIEDSATGTPYHHITTALWKILLLLGIKNPESKMYFYDMITTGMTPIEAIEYIRKNECTEEDEVPC